MTLEEVKDEVRWHIDRCRNMVESRNVNRGKWRWELQGEWNAYENVLEMLESIDEEETDDE